MQESDIIRKAVEIRIDEVAADALRWMYENDFVIGNG